MSVSAYLFLSDNADPRDIEHDNLIVEGVYTIPLCWLASFVSDDLRSSMDDEEGYNAVLVASVEHARQRFTSRIEVLTRYFPVLQNAFSDWNKMLLLVKEPFLKADISELLDSQVAISEHLDSEDEEDDEQRLYGEEEARVREAISFFEKPTRSSWESLFNITALKHHMVTKGDNVGFDAEWPYVIFGIRRVDWLPWKEPESM